MKVFYLFFIFSIFNAGISHYASCENSGFVSKQKKRSIKMRNKYQSKTKAYNLLERVINPKSPMCKYAAKNDISALKKTLSASKNIKADVNTICKNGESLFFIATKNDNYLVAKFLIENGANVNFQNEADTSPLHIVVRKDTVNSNKIFSLLLKSKNLNINVKDIEGYTPLMRAVDFEKIPMVMSLVKAGSDLNVKNNYGYNAVELANMLLDGAKTDEKKTIANNIINILSKNE